MIQINDLAFSYGSKEVLKNITMSLEAGKIYGLLGENGVGKTTLLTLLAGLKQCRQGTILTDGREPYKREPSFLSSIYYLPDEVDPVRQKARQWAMSHSKFWPKFDANIFDELLKLLEVDPNQKMHTMSNGQLKKTYISFGLACRTDYLFMDEPTNGLDIPSKAQFRTALMRFTPEDSCIVISTHQVRDLESVIDPIIILDRQDVLLNASIDTITEKLYFDYGTQIHPDNLYSEMLPGGFIQVLLNTQNRESKVNIEALFNAVHNKKQTIKALFNNE